MTEKPSPELEKFDKAMDKIMSVLRLVSSLSAYSLRSACIGSTDAARRAGK